MSAVGLFFKKLDNVGFNSKLSSWECAVFKLAKSVFRCVIILSGFKLGKKFSAVIKNAEPITKKAIKILVLLMAYFFDIINPTVAGINASNKKLRINIKIKK